MAAKVTAYLGFNTEEFRRNLTRAEKLWDGTQAKIATGAKVAGAAFAAMGVATAGAFAIGMKNGFALNNQLQQAEATFRVFTKSATASKDIIAALRDEADRTPFDTAEMIDAGKALISSAKGSRTELMKLIKTAEVLAALNPQQGLAGAAYSIREALGGDTNSLAERFDMSRQALAKLKAEGKSGLDLINAALAQIGAGPALVTELANTFEGRKGTVFSFFDEMQRRAAQPIFDVASRSMEEFIAYIDGGGKEKAMSAMDEVGAYLGTKVDEALKKLQEFKVEDVVKGAKDVKDRATPWAAAGKNMLKNTLNIGDSIDAAFWGAAARGGQLVGATGFAERSGARAVANLQAIRDRNAAAKAENQAAWAKVGGGGAAGGISQDEVFASYARAHGVKPEDFLKATPEQMAAWESRFGVQTVGNYLRNSGVGNQFVEQQMQRQREAEAAEQARAQAAYQQQARAANQFEADSRRLGQSRGVNVTVTMQTRNPQHAVMAT